VQFANIAGINLEERGLTPNIGVGVLINMLIIEAVTATLEEALGRELDTVELLVEVFDPALYVELVVETLGLEDVDVEAPSKPKIGEQSSSNS
jgi:hypothetical protein